MGQRWWPLLALLLILVLAAALRLLVFQHGPVFLIPRDSGQYFSIGHDLATEGELRLPPKRAPLYPAFLAGIIGVAGPSEEMVAALQHGLGLVSVVLAYLLGVQVAGRAVGLLAALWTAISGSLLLMEQSLMSEALTTPLLLGGLLLALRALEERSARWFIGTGAFLGLAVLARPSVQLVLPLIVVLALWLETRSWRAGLRLVGALLVGYLVVVGPWSVRNYGEHGVFAVSSGLGEALYARVRRHDSKFAIEDRAPLSADEDEARMRREVFNLARRYAYGSDVARVLSDDYGLGDREIDAWLREVSLQVIRQEPERYLLGSARMFVDLALRSESDVRTLWITRTEPKFRNSWPKELRFVLDGAREYGSADRKLIEAVTEPTQDHRAAGLVGLLFIIGTIQCGRTKRWALLLPAVVVSQLAVYVFLDGPVPRYRYPVQPLIAVIGSTGLVAALGMAAKRVWLKRPRGASQDRRLATEPPTGSAASSEMI